MGMKRSPLNTMINSVNNPQTIRPIGKPVKKTATVTGSMSRRAANVLQTSFEPAADATFTEDDYLIIDFVNESGTYANGDFSNKVKNALACWELTYRIRTIPAAYFATEELSKETLATADQQYDEVELFYVHQSYCDHRELNRVVKDILVNYIDPKTYLLAAQVKLQPLNLKDYLAKYGRFDIAMVPDGDYEINYWYDVMKNDNWDFATRPLTSSTVPLNS